MPDEFLHDSADLQWERLTSDDRHVDDWAYARAKVPGGWLVRCERWSAPGVSVTMTFVPDPDYAWTIGRAPVTERAGWQHEPLQPPPPPAQPLTAGMPSGMRVRFTSGAEAKVRYVPQNVKKVITCIDGTRTVEEILQCSQLSQDQAIMILRELIKHDILELFEE